MNPPMIPPTIPPMVVLLEVEAAGLAGLKIDVLCDADRGEDVTPARFVSEAVMTCEGMMTLEIIF